jgi:hypothetical protein
MMNLAMVPGPSLSKASTWQYQQQAIDAEIKSLEESLRALKQRRNTLAPISTLPTEVIFAIFYLLREETDICLALPVAHVCRQWREIALDHPLFWSRLNLTTVSAAGATEILARARKAPLYLEANVPGYRWDNAHFAAFKKELQTHVSHTYRLRISAEQHHFNWTLEGLMSPAPALEHLSLSTGIKYLIVNKPVRVPDTLFDATTPKLSSLELSKCNISWKSPLLKCLKYLTITFNRSPSLTDWLDALERMPQLQKLVLHSASPSDPHFPFDVERTVTLPFLACFDVSASDMECGLALAHLVLPSLTSLRVTASFFQPTLDAVQNFLPYVTKHAYGSQDTDPLRRVVIHNKKSCIDILACPTPNIGDAEGDATLPERVALSIINHYSEVLDDRTRILDAAIAALPLDSLVTFSAPYNTQFGLDKHFWRRQVSRWPLLKHVRLAPLPAHGFREMLLQDDSGRESPPFPLLTRLDLIDSALTGRRTYRLCDTLMKRVEQGAPLEVLDLRSCTATDFAIRLLSEIVVDVWAAEDLEIIGTDGPQAMDLTWDGARSFVSDDESRSGEEDIPQRHIHIHRVLPGEGRTVV